MFGVGRNPHLKFEMWGARPILLADVWCRASGAPPLVILFPPALPGWATFGGRPSGPLKRRTITPLGRSFAAMWEETNPTIGATSPRRSWGTRFEAADAAVGADDEGEGEGVPVLVGVGGFARSGQERAPVAAVVGGDVGAVGAYGDPGFGGGGVGYGGAEAVGWGDGGEPVFPAV